jgi:hypothetical protein
MNIHILCKTFFHTLNGTSISHCANVDVLCLKRMYFESVPVEIMHRNGPLNHIVIFTYTSC